MNLSSSIRIHRSLSFLGKVANSGVRYHTPCLSVYSEKSRDSISANNLHHVFKDMKLRPDPRSSLSPVQFHGRSIPLAFTPTSISLKEAFSDFNVIFPLTISQNFVLPNCYEPMEKIDPLDHNSWEMPSLEGTLKKHAARLIVIRKRKMKKHKLQKLRKKMKFEWAKVRQRREMRKEKAFQAVLISQIKEAEKFDAVQFVADQLKKAHEIQIPRTWKGKRLPEFIIKEKLGIK